MVMLAGVLMGCDVSNYAFRVDESITFTSPEPRTSVALPATIRFDDDDPAPDPRVDMQDAGAEYYAAFVDRAPIGPGRSLAALADDPEICQENPACPGDQLLRDKRVFLVADPEVPIEFLPDLRPTVRGDAKDAHEITVVRMRGRQRVGEAAWTLTFYVDR